MEHEVVRRDLSALCGPASGPQQAWCVVAARRGQPLLLPGDAPAFARAAVRFFVAGRTRRLIALARRAGPWPARRRMRLPPFPATTLFGGAAACPDFRLALCCGSPGPLRKLVALGVPGLSRAGAADSLTSLREQGAVAKLAMRASADASIRQEARWLRLLGRAPATARFVPRLLGEGTLESGRAYFVMNVLPRGSAVAAFGPPHGDFLAALGHCGRSAARWSASPAPRQLRERVAALGGLLDAPAARLLAESLDDVERAIGASLLPSCLAHGDFAPWNIRLAGGQLYVFDWEYAQAQASPLHDFLHFHLIGRVVAGQAPRPAALAALLRAAAAHGGRVFPAWPALGRAVAWLLVHYLVETVSFYVRASGHLDLGHPVLRPYLRLLRERRHWCAAWNA